MKDKEEEVKEANKKYYNLVADVVERVDYRVGEIENCIGEILKKLSREAGNSAFLDLGCGTGVTLRIAKEFFAEAYGIDLSYRMVREASMLPNRFICGDITLLPFEDNTFDVVTSIGVLHHLFSHLTMFKEVHRILKKGGLLYTMQDADSVFIKRFNLPVRLYRKFFVPEKDLLQEKKNLDRELMELAEYHRSRGLDTRRLSEELKEAGFSKVTTNFYWRSASRYLDSLLKRFRAMGETPKGFAPFFSILARK